MTPSKQQAALQGCSAIARKVYDATPMQEAWTPTQIKNALTASTRSSTDQHVVRGCLKALKETGLVRERPPGHFQRIEVREPTPSIQEVTMTTSPGTNTPAKTSVELLADLAHQAASTGRQLLQLSLQIEEAALVVAQEQESTATKLQGLNQLQTLLKSLSQEVPA